MRKFLSRFTVANELLRFFWKERLWWMIPFVLTLLVVAALLIFAQSSPIVPFLYTAF